MYASIFANQVAERYETKNSMFYKNFKNIEKNVKCIKKDLQGHIQNFKKVSFLEKIFSVKNEINGEKKHKVIRTKKITSNL